MASDPSGLLGWRASPEKICGIRGENPVRSLPRESPSPGEKAKGDWGAEARCSLKSENSVLPSETKNEYHFFPMQYKAW